MANPEPSDAGLAAMAQPSQAQDNQAPQQQQNPPNTIAAPLQSNHGNEFRCLWTGCGESHPSAEVLYVSATIPT